MAAIDRAPRAVENLGRLRVKISRLALLAPQDGGNSNCN